MWVSGTVRSRSLNLSWTMPSSEATLSIPIAQYRARLTTSTNVVIEIDRMPVTHAVCTTGCTVTLDGLVPATTYTIQLFAVNTNGGVGVTSLVTPSVTTLSDVPDSVQGIGAICSDQSGRDVASAGVQRSPYY